MTTAVAHPNIALVKYWGKQDKPGNLPATPNLSITLDTLQTETTVEAAERDEFLLNGKAVQDAKVGRFLGALRNRYPLPAYRIQSENNFPTGAGLASSASGFAALMCAINADAGLNMDAEIMSEWARIGSASAARSCFDGFVALVPPLWRAQRLAPASHWPLSVVVAVTSSEAKTVSSTQGMERSRETSAFYNAWVRASGDDFACASDAINQRDFEQLAEVAEVSCLKMHSVMLTSKPTLIYWNAATLACMEEVRRLRSTGTPVFYTIDAGPQVKAVCLPEAKESVAQSLGSIPGVQQTIECGLGDGARVISS